MFTLCPLRLIQFSKVLQLVHYQVFNQKVKFHLLLVRLHYFAKAFTLHIHYIFFFFLYISCNLTAPKYSL